MASIRGKIGSDSGVRAIALASRASIRRGSRPTSGLSRRGAIVGLCAGAERDDAFREAGARVYGTGRLDAAGPI